jgi:hypothetical protein
MTFNIPKPCPANWNEMIPMGDGRYCKSCEKIVVDFTQMSDAEVKAWFGSKQQEKVCGRLKQHQINQPVGLKKRFYQFSKMAAAASLLACTVSCDGLPFSGSGTLGEIALPANSTFVTPEDSISDPSIMGKIIVSDTAEH